MTIPSMIVRTSRFRNGIRKTKMFRTIKPLHTSVLYLLTKHKHTHSLSISVSLLYCNWNVHSDPGFFGLARGHKIQLNPATTFTTLRKDRPVREGRKFGILRPTDEKTGHDPSAPRRWKRMFDFSVHTDEKPMEKRYL